MYWPMPAPQPQPPPRVQAAMQFIAWLHGRGQSPAVQMPGEGWKTEDREDVRTPQECRVYESAMEVLRLYFSGENDFGETLMNTTHVNLRPGDDDPRNPEPART